MLLQMSFVTLAILLASVTAAPLPVKPRSTVEVHVAEECEKVRATRRDTDIEVYTVYGTPPDGEVTIQGCVF